MVKETKSSYDYVRAALDRRKAIVQRIVENHPEVLEDLSVTEVEDLAKWLEDVKERSTFLEALGPVKVGDKISIADIFNKTGLGLAEAKAALRRQSKIEVTWSGEKSQAVMKIVKVVK